jgi:WD40 repeat protein
MALVFISHSSRDNALAAEIISLLRARGFENVFLDFDKHAGIPPGANWERDLYRMIDSAHAVILVLTPNWYESKWCFFEFGQARALGKAIFPVIVAPTGDRYIAPDIQSLDLQMDREGGLERLARELTRLALDAQGGFPWDSSRGPYPGFMAFQKEDAAVFFGRDDDTRRTIERLNARRVQGGAKLVLLLGASGSGKSSVVRAGVLPRLERDSRNWVIVSPFRPRRDPTGELAYAVSELLGTDEDREVWRERFLSSDVQHHLEDFVGKARVRAKAREACVLITVDQGEELFAVAADEHRNGFFKMLEAATAEHVPIIVLMVLRSDYLDRFQRACQGFRFEELSLGPLPLARVRQIIEGPARVAGLRIEEGLVATALVDMQVEDALPLVAFRLRDLYDRFVHRDGQARAQFDLTLAHYLALGDPAAGLNPLENAVRERADQVLKDLALSEEDLQALREAFVGAMVRVDDEGQYARRPALWNELPIRAQPALEKLAQVRLLVIRAEQGVTTIEVAHEALIRKWPRLKAWLDLERDFLVGKAQLRYALEDWKNAPQPEKNLALLHGLALSRARQWRKDHGQALAEQEKGYIDASIIEDEKAARHQLQRRRAAWAGAAVLLLFIVASLFFVQQERAATVRADAAALAIEARSSLSEDSIRAVRIAAQAVEKNASAETQSILLESVLALSPYLIGALRVPSLEPTSLAWASGQNAIVVGGWGRLVRWQPAMPDRASAVVSVEIDKDARTTRMRSPVLAAAYPGRRIVAITEDGRRVTVDDAGAVASAALLEGDLAKVALAEDATAALVARRDEAEVVLFRCKNPTASQGACTRTAVAPDYASAVAFDPAHAVAAIGRDDGIVKLIGTGDQQLSEERSLAGPVASLAFSRAGERLAIGTTTGRTIVMDAHGALMAEASAGTGSVSALAWNPDGTRLAAACGSSSICVWRLSREGTLQLALRAHGHTQPVNALAFSPDGRQLLSAADETIRIWSLDAPDRTSFAVATDADAALTDLATSSDRRWLAAGDGSGNLHVWDLQMLARQASPRSGQGAEIRSIAWSPRTPTLAIMQADGRVEVRNWPDGTDARRLADEGEDLYALTWLPDGSSLVTAGGNDGAIKIRSIAGGKGKALPPVHQDSVLTLAVTADGSRLFSADAIGKVWRWDLPNRQPLDRSPIETGASRGTLVLSHDESRLLVAGNDGDVLVYKTGQPDADNPPMRCRSGSKDIDGAAFGPDDRLIFAVSGDAILHIWSFSERCEIVASAPLLPPSGRTAAGAPQYHRRHLVVIPELGAVAVTISTNEVRLVSIDPNAWLKRAHAVARFER